MSIEAMKQALEALETADEVGFWELQKTAITALRTAIAEAEKQEPVAWQVHPFDYGIGHEGVYARTDRPEQVEMWKRKGWAVQPLYTNPTSAQRQPLTDEQIDDIWNRYCDEMGEASINDAYDIARAIEAAHGIKGEA